MTSLSSIAGESLIINQRYTAIEENQLPRFINRDCRILKRWPHILHLYCYAANCWVIPEIFQTVLEVPDKTKSFEMKRHYKWTASFAFHRTINRQRHLRSPSSAPWVISIYLSGRYVYGFRTFSILPTHSHQPMTTAESNIPGHVSRATTRSSWGSDNDGFT